MGADGAERVPAAGRSATRPRLAGLVLLVLLAVQASLLAWTASRNSATIDEPSHLVAGLHALARVLAALPAWAAHAETDWSAYSGLPLRRDEFRLGLHFVRINPQRWAFLLFSGRLVICLFLLAATLVCFRWARALQGPATGLLAAALWAFCPLALGYGPLITADAACAACTCWTLYRFWLWLRAPSAGNALWASLSLGLALLSKFTCLILPAVYWLIWMAWRALGSWQAGTAAGNLNSQALARPTNAARSATQLALICAGALLLVNAAFAFRGTGTALGEYAFASSFLTGNPHARGSHEAVGENRFRQTWAGAMPVPLPREYVSGIDLQAADLDARRSWPLFLNGEWVRGGRWFFYAQALAFKLPAGFLFLLALCAAGALARAIWAAARRGASRSIAVNGAVQPPAWLAHLTLLLPVLAILGALTLNCQLALRAALRAAVVRLGGLGGHPAPGPNSNTSVRGGRLRGFLVSRQSGGLAAQSGLHQ